MMKKDNKKEYILRFFFVLFTIMFLTPIIEFFYVLNKPIETHPVRTERFGITNRGLYNEYKMTIEYSTWIFEGDYGVIITRKEYQTLTDNDEIKITNYLSIPYSLRYVRNVAIINCLFEIFTIIIFIKIDKMIKKDRERNNGW